MGMVVRGILRGCQEVVKMHHRGEISTRQLGLLLVVPVGGVVFCCYEYGPDVVVGAALQSDVVVIREQLSEEEKQQELDALEEERHDLQRMGKVTLLAGTAPPPGWTSDQAGPHPKREFEAVPIGPETATRAAIESCLRGNDIGRGGRDAVTGRPYSRLEVVDAWRIENATLWGKFAAERMQVRATMQRLSKRARARVATPHIRPGLARASATLRAEGGYDSFINEKLLLHGLGEPSKALNIIGSGFNEHFSGVNAGTMFGDGVYLAEDMGKSDQYCAAVPCGGLLGRPSPDYHRLEAELWKDGRKPPAKVTPGELRFVFLCRSVLGVFVQVGSQRTQQLHSGEAVFAAGTRELALIPGLDTPTHYHSEIAEVAPAYAVGDTHAERGGSSLRFREFVVFHPTLLYPEYLVAYRRV